MGDSGSLFIGFLLGCFSLMWGEKSATLLGLSAPLIVLAFPLTDTILAMVRRKLRRTPVFGADRGHIHHRLLDRGLSPRQITDLMCVLTVFLASLAILTSIAEHLAVCIVVVLLTGVSLAIHQLRYVEFEAVRRVVVRLFWQHVTAEMHVIQLEEALEKAGNLKSCVESINAACEPFGVCAEFYAAKDLPLISHQQLTSSQWELRIPVSGEIGACLRSDARTGGEMRLPTRLVDTAVSGIRRHCTVLPGLGNVVGDPDNSCRQ
jgi:UDP-GlcNAc:undecaprenyl-phosphate GlcNAc-1-phosphate transferase